MLRRPVSVLRGFSLVEVVLAVAIVGFAVLAIVGLFPVGYRAALESRRETRASYLAEQLIGDLRAGPWSNAAVLYGSTPDQLQRWPVDLTQSGTSVFLGDEANLPLDVLTNAADYQNPQINAAAAYLASVAITPDPILSNLSRVEVEVSTPASAPLARRSRFGVVTYLGAW